MEERAERLYNAVAKTLAEIGTLGLLAAAGDAKAHMPWRDVSPKTRLIFLKLEANLTVQAPKA